MIRAFKTLLLWLLIAALPVQGMAAVIKASCGPGRHDAATVAMHSDAHHHADHAHDHDDAHAVERSASIADDTGDSEHGHKSSSCSACAACCVGAAAPPPSASSAPVAPAYRTAIPSLAVSFTAFVPSGPERPPRRLFA